MPSSDYFKDYSNEELIREVCKRLEEISPIEEKGFEDHEGGKLARSYCRKLLEAAKTTGHGGCQLCLS